MATKDDVIRTFKAFDKDGSNTIEEHELRNVLQSIGGEAGFTADQVSRLMLDFDANKDGKIQVEEFIQYVFEDDILFPLLDKSTRLRPHNVPPELKAKLQAIFDRLAAANHELQGDFEQDASTATSESVGLKELRDQYRLDRIPEWLGTAVVSFHLKHTPLTTGDHQLKLSRLAPHSGDGLECILCLIDDVGRHGVDHFLYSLCDGKLNKLEAGIELMNEAEAKLPRDVKLWCQLCLGADGGEKCTFSRAMSVLAESGLLDIAEIDKLSQKIRSQKDFVTLSEFIHEVNESFGVDENDPEAQKLLKRAAEEPKNVISELSCGFGTDVSIYVTEPDLSIEWILAQLPPTS